MNDNPLKRLMPLNEGSEKLQHLDVFQQLSIERKLHVYELLGVREGHHILDVGCGAGSDTIKLGRLVGTCGRIIGVDIDSAIVEEANRRAAEEAVETWVEHRVCDAFDLPFADNSFDACHSERVFMHLQNPEQVFAHMVRVTKPGGSIAVIDLDGASLSVDTEESEIERRIMSFWIEKHNNGYAGRKLYRYFNDHGLVDICVEIKTGPYFNFDRFAYLCKLDDLQNRALQAEAVTQAEIRRFRASLEQAASRNAFFATANLITVVGYKP